MRLVLCPLVKPGRTGKTRRTCCKAAAASSSACWAPPGGWLTGQSRAEELRKALDFLDKDQSFDVFAPDDTLRGIDALGAPEVDIAITGHTHLVRSLRRQRGFGHCFNSGSGATLMQITPAARQDAQRYLDWYAPLRQAPADWLPALCAAAQGIVDRLPLVERAAWDCSTG